MKFDRTCHNDNFQSLVLIASLCWLIVILSFPLLSKDWEPVRHISVAFAVFLALLLHNGRGKSCTKIKKFDFFLAIFAVGCILYPWLNIEALGKRYAYPTTFDALIASTGMVLLLLAISRALNVIAIIITLLMLFYVFFGEQEWLPEEVQWRGAQFGKILWHFWMNTEGVFRQSAPTIIFTALWTTISTVIYFSTYNLMNFYSKNCNRLIVFGTSLAVMVVFFVAFRFLYSTQKELAITTGMILFTYFFIQWVFDWRLNRGYQTLSKRFTEWSLLIAYSAISNAHLVLIYAVGYIILGTVSLTGMHMFMFELLGAPASPNWFLSVDLIVSAISIPILTIARKTKILKTSYVNDIALVSILSSKVAFVLWAFTPFSTTKFLHLFF